ncbi:MAG: hypothetical protein LBR64_10770 [Dysgonamonadaceae bacterium]|jgi:hypothetical protein|nr:hypothetical protein [Dysgonamonadaceae bacterium]
MKKIINLKQGETLTLHFTVNSELHNNDMEADMWLFVVRGMYDRILFSKWGNFTFDEEAGKYKFDVVCPHSETERFAPGTYSWGVSIYRSAQTNTAGMPVNGDPVIIPVESSPFVVINVVSKETGL